MCKFIGLRNIQLTGRESGTDVTDSGLEAVFSFMLENKDILCNSAEVYDIYISCCSSILSFPIVIEKVKERCPLSVLKIRKDGSEDDELEHSKIKVARCIKRECKEIKCKRTHYDIHINKDKMDDAVSQTLSSMLSLVSPKLNKTLSAAIIGNIVTSEVTNEATDCPRFTYPGFQKVVDKLYDYRVTCSYQEVGKFKKSAAHASYTDTSVQGISHAGTDLIQIIADNFNADILVTSPNGKLSTHVLAMIVIQPLAAQSPETTEENRSDEYRRKIYLKNYLNMMAFTM